MKRLLITIYTMLIAACDINYQPVCINNCKAGVLDIPATGDTELSLLRRGDRASDILAVGE